VAIDPSRITVNLTDRSVTALDTLASVEELSKTDVVNRALQIYDFIVKQRVKGKDLLLRDAQGQIELVQIV
jgi:hypothetical protein